MNRIESLHGAYRLGSIPTHVWRVLSILLPVASVALFFAVLTANFQIRQIALGVPVALLGGTFILAFLLAAVFLHLRLKQLESARTILTTENQLEQIEDNIQEIFWMVDAETKEVLRMNRAYETITGRSCRSLIDHPSSYREIIHPHDRARLLTQLDKRVHSENFDERFRITKPNGETRWVWVRGFPVSDSAGRISRWVGTALDITLQKEAEDQVAANLTLAKSAWAEADALRKATLALTEDLHMNHVLDTLLESLTEFIACEYAQILLLEGDTRLLVAREKVAHSLGNEPSCSPIVFEANEFPFFRTLIFDQKSVLVPSTEHEPEWRSLPSHDAIRSWLGVPLIASGKTLGVLSLGHSQTNAFTKEHLHFANSLAIPAAAAIQNARLYERASLYGSELGKRVYALDAAGKALELAEEDRKLSEDKFHKVFYSSPLPFSITTADEGRFVAVNPAFELRYGYSRDELIGHTVEELRIWENPSDRKLMITCLNRGGPIRNVITQLRVKSGEIKLTAYSANWIQFEGKKCILAVSQDASPADANARN